MDAFIGTVLPVAFGYAPVGWTFCNGQTMAISQNNAMFALLGTLYGGDGRQTFGIPDLRGRVIVGSQQQGPGLTNVVQGQMAGTNGVNVIATGAVNISISNANLPAHTHPIAASTISIAIPVCSTSGTSNTDTPGTTTILTKGTVVSGPVNTTSKQYTTAVKDSTLLPFDAAIAAGTTGANPAGQPLVAPVSTSAVASIMQPYLGLNYIICVTGIYPSRN